jgi:hypothetical protein
MCRPSRLSIVRFAAIPQALSLEKTRVQKETLANCDHTPPLLRMRWSIRSSVQPPQVELASIAQIAAQL